MISVVARKRLIDLDDVRVAQAHERPILELSLVLLVLVESL